MNRFCLFSLFCFAIILPFLSNGQYNLNQNKIWAVGNKSGVDFSGGDPVPINTSLMSAEGSASVCNVDENSRLLFYTNGLNVWNATGDVMPNGDGIFPGASNNNLSVTQAAVIVPDPQPGSTKYYVFSLDSWLYCNVVDMALNNGTGDVVTGFPLRNIALGDSLTEKMIAIPGCNNNIWLLVRSRVASKFLAYEITASGVNTIPVTSYAGHFAPGHYSQGVMKASPKGDRIITAMGNGLEYYHFDYTTGQVYGASIIDNMFCYGAAFSPDGSKVYASTTDVYQYDLNAADPYQTKTYLGQIFVSDLKLAVDGKIYFKSNYSQLSGGTRSYLGSIEQPNNAGVACHFRDSVSSLVFLNEPAPAIPRIVIGMPNEVVVAGKRGVSPGRVLLDTALCSFPPSGIRLDAISGFTGYTWNDGNTNDSRDVMQAGIYWVRYVTSCGVRTDTFRITSGATPVVLTFNNPVISTSGSYQGYRWYKGSNLIPGANSSTLTTTGNDWYSVVVTDSEGCTDSASLQISSTGISENELKSHVFCYPNPVMHTLRVSSPVPVKLRLCDLSGRILIYAENSTLLDMAGLSNGIYFLKIADRNGMLIKTEKVIKE